MAPGRAIRFVFSIGAKGGIMLAQKWCFPGGAKMRDASGDTEISGVEERGQSHVKPHIIGVAFQLHSIQGPIRPCVKTKTPRAGDDRLHLC
jgi:hypothetical protein